MAITTDDGEPIQSTLTAELDVRVPAESDVDTTTEAERRIASIDGVQTVTVEGLNGIQPRLSAIVTTVTVRIEATIPVGVLHDHLSQAVPIDGITRLAQTEP